MQDDYMAKDSEEELQEWFHVFNKNQKPASSPLSNALPRPESGGGEAAGHDQQGGHRRQWQHRFPSEFVALMAHSMIR